MPKEDPLNSVQSLTVFLSENSNYIESNMEPSAYKKMYNTMFNVTAEAIEKFQEAAVILCRAQQHCEQLFITASEPSLELYRESAE